MKITRVALISLLGILLVSGLACGVGNSNTKTSNFIMIGELPVTTVGDISMSWDHKGDEFLIVGGQDLFGKGDPCHTRFILSGDGDNIQTIEFVDSPTTEDYQRYCCVRFNPTQDYALISGINGNVSKISGEHIEVIPTGTNEPLWAITWEPHGDYALIGGWNFILKYDGTSIYELDTDGHGFIDASWNPNGTYVLLADADEGEIGLYDGESFSVLPIPGYEHYSVQAVSFSPVLEYALIAVQDGRVNCPCQALLAYDGYNFKTIEHRVDEFPGSIVWKPDGTFAFLSGNMNTQYKNGEVSSINIGMYGSPLMWSPHGEYLVFMGECSREDYDCGYIQIWKWYPSE